MTGTLVRLRSIDNPQLQPSVMHIELATPTASYRVIGLIWPFAPTPRRQPRHVKQRLRALR
eukprot:133599-Prymnesium_polylepis.1